MSVTAKSEDEWMLKDEAWQEKVMREAEVDEFDTISATSLPWVVYFRV